MNETVNILIAGDTHLGGGRVKELALQNAIEPLFGNFLGNIQNAHLAITNLESPLVDQAESILKIGPNLKSPVSSIRVLQKAGFDLVTLANNHIMDQGKKGFKSTVTLLNKNKIPYIGAGRNIDKAKNLLQYNPLFSVKDGLKITWETFNKL
jgi:poly-gamma-glutamate synthesis protein (capsule biosynthesis protein)